MHGQGKLNMLKTSTSARQASTIQQRCQSPPKEPQLPMCGHKTRRSVTHRQSAARVAWDLARAGERGEPVNSSVARRTRSRGNVKKSPADFSFSSMHASPQGNLMWSLSLNSILPYSSLSWLFTCSKQVYDLVFEARKAEQD